MAVAGYERLEAVFARAVEQAASGKGRKRHATEGAAYEEQPMVVISKLLGSNEGNLWQAIKKIQESKRLLTLENGQARARAELLGALNYIAGAIIVLDELRYDPGVLDAAGSAG